MIIDIAGDLKRLTPHCRAKTDHVRQVVLSSRPELQGDAVMWLLLIAGLGVGSVSAKAAESTAGFEAEQMQSLTRQLNENPAVHLDAAQGLFRDWCKAAPDNESLRQFRSRLTALAALREEITKQLERAGQHAVGKLVENLWDDQGGESPAAKDEVAVAIVSAEQFYKLYLPYFRYALDTQGLRPKEKEFLKAYYQAEMQLAISEIMRLGRPLATASEARAGEVECYLIVLPLLHNGSRFSMEALQELPSWMWGSSHLERLAEFCLLRARRLDAAEAITLKLRQQEPIRENRFSVYVDMAERCVAVNVPATAVQCLETACALLDPHDPRRLTLRTRMCTIWAGAKNWALAASTAGQIARDHPGSPAGSQALILRMDYLAAQNDHRTLLVEIEEVIDDQRCEKARPQLCYYQWQALRQTGQTMAASVALKRFLEKYPDDAHGAEMHYLVAIDCLSARQYEQALSVLELLESRYPNSPMADKAKGLTERLRPLIASGKRSSSRPGESN